MTVELISVGTELLMGNIVNSNTQFLAEKCAMLGLDMYYQVTVGDNYGRMKEVVKTALGRSDIIILTGGLGPTEDDLTKEVCADVMGMELVEDLHTRKHLEAFFEHNIYREIPDNNWKMATVPSGALVLDNGNGMAPGLILEKDGKAAILLPGPPAVRAPAVCSGIQDGKNMRVRGEPGGGKDSGPDRQSDESYHCNLCQDGGGTPAHHCQGRHGGRGRPAD